MSVGFVNLDRAVGGFSNSNLNACRSRSRNGRNGVPYQHTSATICVLVDVNIAVSHLGREDTIKLCLKLSLQYLMTGGT